MFKVLRILTVILIAGSTILKSAQISLPERHGPPGSILSIPLRISDVQNLAGGEILLEFDTNLLEFKSIDSMLTENNFHMVSGQRDNHIAITFARANGITMNMLTVCNLSIRVKRSAAPNSTSELTIKSTVLYDESLNEIPCDIEHGVIKITSGIVVFPNPITPNNDGYNDVVRFVIPETSTGNVICRIFNLSGIKINEITQQSNSDFQWNGSDDSGKTVIPGVYIFQITENGKQLASGSITVIR